MPGGSGRLLHWLSSWVHTANGRNTDRARTPRLSARISPWWWTAKLCGSIGCRNSVIERAACSRRTSPILRHLCVSIGNCTCLSLGPNELVIRVFILGFAATHRRRSGEGPLGTAVGGRIHHDCPSTCFHDGQWRSLSRKTTSSVCLKYRGDAVLERSVPFMCILCLRTRFSSC